MPDDDYPVEPITKLFNLIDYFKRDLPGAAADYTRGALRAIPQGATDLGGALVKHITHGLVDPTAASQQMAALLRETPLASTGTSADVAGERIGFAPATARMSALLRELPADAKMVTFHATKDARPYAIASRPNEGSFKAYDSAGKEIGEAGAVYKAGEYPLKPGQPGVVASSGVDKDWQRQGVGTALYDAAERHSGPIVPSDIISEDAQNFWAKRDPAALREKIRAEFAPLPERMGSGNYSQDYLKDVLDIVPRQYPAAGSKRMAQEELQAVVKLLRQKGLYDPYGIRSAPTPNLP